MMEAGVHAYLLSSVYAARIMAATGGGLITHLTDGIDGYRGQLYWDLAHEAINRMAAGMGRKGKKANIAVVARSPGFMRTERVLLHVKTDAQKQAVGFDKAESPEYVGRAVVALAADARRLQQSGNV